MSIEPFMLHKSTLPHLKRLVKELLSDPGAMWEVKIKKWSKRRSLSSNALFHVWCAEISSYLLNKGLDQFTPEFTKDYLKFQIRGYEERTFRDESSWEVVTLRELFKTSKMDQGEMHFWMEQVQDYAFRRFGLMLSAPSDSEFTKLNMEQEK